MRASTGANEREKRLLARSGQEGRKERLRTERGKRGRAFAGEIGKIGAGKEQSRR
jgi:hypothetical protein